MPIKKLNRKKTYYEIVNQLIELVEKGEFKHGEKIPSENILTKKFGVSRPTVREALSALEVLGVIECRPGDGTYIKDAAIDNEIYRRVAEIMIKERSPYEVAEARKYIEGITSYLAAERSDKESIKNIQFAFNNIEKEYKKNKKWSVETDINFHLSIARSINNSIFEYLATYVISFMNTKSWRKQTNKILLDTKKSKKYFNQSKKIFNAIVSRDPETAKKIMTEHLKDFEKDFVYK